jgi:uncharacterized coiled-coil protein SlyX
LAEKESQLAQLRGQLEVKERVIAERDAVVNETNSRLADCELRIAAQSTSLEQLREALKEASGTVSEQDLLTKSQLQVRYAAYALKYLFACTVYGTIRVILLSLFYSQPSVVKISRAGNITQKQIMLMARSQEY